MVFRIFVEKKKGFDFEAKGLLSDVNNLLEIKGVKDIRMFNRYDVENVSEELFEKCKPTVFSEPQTDDIYDVLPDMGDAVFFVEYLPGQFDQRADSCAQCIQMVSMGDRPEVRTARVYVLYGDVSDADLEAIKKYVINPVESRECDNELKTTLEIPCEIPTSVEVLNGFIGLSDAELADFVEKYALAMDKADIKCCQDYFISEKRDPTLTEIRMLDTYWSDHCRHTTFLTRLDEIEIDGDNEVAQKSFDRYLNIRKELGREDRPITLMDIATMGARYLKKQGKLPKLDESEEINACTVKIKVDVDGDLQDWLFLFKNETHNHPTEIEPFGGAATCIGGAIRDPLSGRSYVYQAMRVTGAADPTVPVSATMKGKLPQRKLVTTAAAGYSSYGNQIGLATGLVDEIYHPGYAAKRMEIGAVVGAAPEKNVVRLVPEAGDVVVLLGGRTGRDGCGGATGSSKSHNLSSLESCGAEVQKGNAPEERKLQRLFRNEEATRLIKRCNDFGAGGVSVAIGELADGLYINLNAVPKKYEGLDGTELAISESQERMAVVLDKNDVDKFMALAASENLEATRVATVTTEPRLVMEWNGVKICDIAREFLNSNGAEKNAKAHVTNTSCYKKKVDGNFKDIITEMASDLNMCSKRGLSERFDSTIGKGSVLMPFGGKYQMTPSQVMAAKIPVLTGDTTTCSVMGYGYNPFVSEVSPYHGAYLAVVESVSKLVAAGAWGDDCYLTFQEYFERLRTEPERWGKPVAALLGALDAQLDLELGSIGGKDSMSGSFEDIDVPPTLVSFAVSIANAGNITSNEFKKCGSKVYLLAPEYNKGLPVPASLKANYDTVTKLIKDGKVLSASTVTYGGAAGEVLKMSLGNKIGMKFENADMDTLFGYNYGAFVLEMADDTAVGTLLGETTCEYALAMGCDKVDMNAVQELYEDKLEGVFACNITKGGEELPKFSYEAKEVLHAPAVISGKPRVLVPVFPGTNCEYDTAKTFRNAGADPEIFIVRNLKAGDVSDCAKEFAKLIEKTNIIFLPGGFSGGDEPDGSGKFITAFFRNPEIKDAVHNLLHNKDGLMAGICNGFQALIKLGLVPYGEIRDMDDTCPTLTFNTISRHQSRIVSTRVCSNKSPWLANCKVGDIHTMPISHGEGRFVCSDELLKTLADNGQIATQYVDNDGNPTMDIRFNPNGSIAAIEGITSPDGRVFGKMGHSERLGKNLYRNISGNLDTPIFDNAVKYFK